MTRAERRREAWEKYRDLRRTTVDRVTKKIYVGIRRERKILRALRGPWPHALQFANRILNQQRKARRTRVGYVRPRKAAATA